LHKSDNNLVKMSDLYLLKLI